MIEKQCGERPSSCPWRALQDPIVHEAIEAYRWFESGQLATWLGPEPPAVIVQAIGIYHAAIGHVRANDMRLARQNRNR